MGIYYHYAAIKDRDSIREYGLMPRHPRDGSSAGETMNNPAGAAVYLWRDWMRTSHSEWTGVDLWAVEIDDDKVQTDLSNLKDFGAVHVVGGAPVGPENVRFVAQMERRMQLADMDLIAADLQEPHHLEPWLEANSPSWAAVQAEQDPSLSTACLDTWAYWDGDDETGDWRTAAAVCTSNDHPGLVLTPAGWEDPMDIIRRHSDRDIDCHGEDMRLRPGLELYGNYRLREVSENTKTVVRELESVRPQLSQGSAAEPNMDTAADSRVIDWN